MAEALVTLRDILVRYGDVDVLDVPDLSVRSGEVLAIIGPNGAGKSTLLRVMGLLERPTRGVVCFRGREVDRRDLLPLRRRIASVFQQALLLNASVYENAALGLKLRGLDRRSIEQRVFPWLERLGIAHLAGRRARSLSGGEAQRASLSRALALDPELLLLDEPFSALDHPTREQLLLDLEEILQETGVTTVFVTHDRNEASIFGDRLGVLIGGRLVQVGETAEVFSRPADENVADLVGVETRIPATVEKSAQGRCVIRFAGGSIRAGGDFQPGERLLLCVRSEEIALRPVGRQEPARDGFNELAATVLKIRPLGTQHRIELDCGGNRLVALLTRSSLSELGAREGEQVIASFSEAAVHAVKRG
ncbi:MAG TPA: ABC transporter ATP-binding protein [candidate division Zixibacteria bacterium]|nr:ABC transporter ATP-binding protein [candidate division Zixibacteria bacterium]